MKMAAIHLFSGALEFRTSTLFYCIGFYTFSVLHTILTRRPDLYWIKCKELCDPILVLYYYCDINVVGDRPKVRTS